MERLCKAADDAHLGLDLTKEQHAAVAAQRTAVEISLQVFTGKSCKREHPLEGSCQEVKLPPYTPCAFFFAEVCCMASRPPSCRLGRARIFSGFGYSRIVAPHQTPIRIKAR